MTTNFTKKATNVTGTTGHSHAKINESRHRLMPITKVNSKLITDIKHKIIKLLENDLQENLDDLP